MIPIEAFCGGRPFIEPRFHTYQEFYLHTEALAYILIIVSPVGIAWFWYVLPGKDKIGNDF